MSAAPEEEPARRPPNRVIATWKSGLVMESSRADGAAPPMVIDGNTKEAQGPVDALLSALAACAASDVVLILEKQRTPLEVMEVEVIGTRVETTPRRLAHVQLKFRIGGKGITQVAAMRAVELAVTKYCSVRDSLRPDVPVEFEVTLV
ncbi:MAG: OsmC family protein [Gemmatimonadaceae bacterium]